MFCGKEWADLVEASGRQAGCTGTAGGCGLQHRLLHSATAQHSVICGHLGMSSLQNGSQPPLTLPQNAVRVPRDFGGCSVLRQVPGQLHYLQNSGPRDRSGHVSYHLVAWWWEA